ncbi:MAG: hypothetical protein NZ703_05300 [Gemmataceae bacterium]|nr:hypothetical protein [Gemmataceae bacterium]MCS7270482.1 hypothetical protein [Gemmataceae bacterium]MDW8242459.1 hypothetical protein [Thermogemmata sp.]
MLTEEQRQRLVASARAAAARAFLSGPAGTAYGAAVLTATGRTYQAAQYSSFNHITNIHAEQAALVLATMADDPDIVALALACTAGDAVARPCGVCRQVMAEHAFRTGRDFEVLMANPGPEGHELARVSQLLPQAWLPPRELLVANKQEVRCALPQVGHPRGDVLPRVADQVILPDGSVAIVWDERFESEGILVKLKYAPQSDGKLRKLPHAFTQPLLYQKELYDIGWLRVQEGRLPAAVISPGQITAVFATLPLDSDKGEPPGPLMELLAEAGVPRSAIRVTGSRALGLQQSHSDWDLLVSVEISTLKQVRERLARAIAEGRLAIPPQSGTWKLLDRIFPGGRQALLHQRRFVDTVSSGGVSVALWFTPPSPPATYCVEPDWTLAGRAVVYGTVTYAEQAPYKRAEYIVHDHQGSVRVTCYHKAANLLRAGDVVSVSGWLLRRDNLRHLIQILPIPDRILWWRTTTT